MFTIPQTQLTLLITNVDIALSPTEELRRHLWPPYFLGASIRGFTTNS
jgi:hypothetical protein